MYSKLHLFWLKRISGNHFTPTYVFGKHKKLSQMEINFHVDCKIALSSRKWISVSILPSNDFHPRKIEEREREGKSKKRSHRNRSWSVDRTRSWSIDDATAPNPKSHQSRHTLALARLRRLSTVEIVTQSSPLFSFSTQSSSTLPRSRTKAHH